MELLKQQQRKECAVCGQKQSININCVLKKLFSEYVHISADRDFFKHLAEEISFCC